ncbi:transcriptional regulator BolA [Providencia alcalifaciens]|nr:transcriptional regulator BolA [Providencia alcalifaciens]
MGANVSQTMQSRVSEKLKTAFEPEHMEVINESHQHNVFAGFREPF